MFIITNHLDATDLYSILPIAVYARDDPWLLNIIKITCSSNIDYILYYIVPIVQDESLILYIVRFVKRVIVNRVIPRRQTALESPFQAIKAPKIRSISQSVFKQPKCKGFSCSIWFS